jgi:hypothetical protein
VVNNRFWPNRLNVLHNGISLAPVSEGPVWVPRHRFTDFEESSFKVSKECSGHNDPPGFERPEEGALALICESPYIDAGERIYGINDVFAGDASDLGCLEFCDEDFAPGG